MPRLEFTERDLFVGYRASLERQTLRIRVRTGGLATDEMGPMNMMFLRLQVLAGAGAGAEFDPRLSEFEVLEGTINIDDPHAKGPDHEWVIGVRAVSPRFMRTIVERLKTAGDQHPVLSMVIEGSLPADRTPLSARTEEVQAWLDDRDAYPGAWSEPGFPLADGSTGKSATVRVRLKQDVTKAIIEAFEDRLAYWKGSIRNYLNARGDGPGIADFLARTVHTKRELRARLDLFDYRRQASLDALSNVLCRFHHEVAAIAHAEVDLPG